MEDQPSLSSRLRQGSDISCSYSDRKDERRAAVIQMMAENREGLGMKVIAVMVQRYGVLPKEMWDLNSISDMGAGRGITYDKNVSRATLESILSNNRYSIVNLSIRNSDHKVELPSSLRRLNIMAREYNYHLDPLPASLQELTFDQVCTYNKPLAALPRSLRKLVLGERFHQPIVPPPDLVELELGSAFKYPLILPQRLKRLAFDSQSQFNFGVTLPPTLRCARFGNAYNQPTILPPGIEELRVGVFFTRDLSLPDTLRKIEWCCSRPIQIPEGVCEIYLGGVFNQPLTLPANLTKATYASHSYTQPVIFPSALEELAWCRTNCEGLVLPAGLRKLTWVSISNFALPLGLKELVIESQAPLVLPEGLLKVTLDCWSHGGRYILPESVQEVICLGHGAFTHPSTLQHLILRKNSFFELNLPDHKIHKLTIGDSNIVITRWPQELKELEFTVDNMKYPLRVPKGCSIVGEKRPTNVIME